MIIGTCGFGSTGSSAVSDYLKEYDQFQVMDKIEFTWVSSVDGLVDLDRHLNNPHTRTAESIVAIERYRQLCKRRKKSYEYMGLPWSVFEKSVNDFLDSITQLRWMWTNDQVPKGKIDLIFRRILFKSGLIGRWERAHKRSWSKYPLEEISFSVKPKDFEIKARKHVREILEGLGVDFARPVVLDQPFPGNNPQACMKYYEDSFAVVVDRDPRDNYVFAKTKLLGRNHLMPMDDVKDFVVYYRALRDNQPYMEKNDRILQLRFEDLVYNYDVTTEKLRNFLKLPANPNPKSIFDPKISMPNTQVWKRFPRFADDIKYIEENLSEYLFDFSDCPVPDPNGIMFSGKSPLNK